MMGKDEKENIIMAKTIASEEGFKYGVEMGLNTVILLLKAQLAEIKIKHTQGGIVIGYWQVRGLIEDIIKKIEALLDYKKEEEK